MIYARVEGNVVSTIHHPSMRGRRTLICQPIDEHDEPTGEPILAIDEQGARLHTKVIITTDGIFTRDCVADQTSPLRNMVLGLIDAD